MHKNEIKVYIQFSYFEEKRIKEIFKWKNSKHIINPLKPN